MSAGTLALLIGLFIVPAAILALGHRLRRRPRRLRALFWGALVGYGVAAIVAMVAGMIPPAEWSGEDTWRGLFGFWGMSIGATIGAAVGWLSVSNSARP